MKDEKYNTKLFHGQNWEEARENLQLNFVPMRSMISIVRRETFYYHLIFIYEQDRESRFNLIYFRVYFFNSFLNSIFWFLCGASSKFQFTVWYVDSFRRSNAINLLHFISCRRIDRMLLNNFATDWLWNLRRRFVFVTSEFKDATSKFKLFLHVGENVIGNII